MQLVGHYENKILDYLGQVSNPAELCFLMFQCLKREVAIVFEVVNKVFVNIKFIYQIDIKPKGNGRWGGMRWDGVG